MTFRTNTETELKAWDTYFSAALEVVKGQVVGSNTNDYLEKVTRLAADMADKMVAERRKRA